LLFSMTVS